ncbi:MAG: HAD hydrolase-like protein [Candidatus Thorarchaeota archaeon]|nr:MAG: HAD hydrolase-like protein [Candidatus Thorarchaeota archaeon]
MELSEKSLWVFDVDNTLVLDVEHPKVFPDALNLWNHLESLGKTNAILTNVGRLSSRQIHNVLSKAGFETTIERTFSAGAAAAAHVHNRAPGANCFVISEGGATEDFVLRGLNVTNNPPVEFVAVAADRGLTFQELNFATKMVKEGAALICISGSWDYRGVYLGAEDVYIGERSITAAIEHATGAEAVVVGKPLPEIFIETVKVLGFEIEDSVMIGDNPDSDIAGGNAAGMTTVLVDRGRDNVTEFDSKGLDREPDISVSSLDEIISLL